MLAVEAYRPFGSLKCHSIGIDQRNITISENDYKGLLGLLAHLPQAPTTKALKPRPVPTKKHVSVSTSGPIAITSLSDLPADVLYKIAALTGEANTWLFCASKALLSASTKFEALLEHTIGIAGKGALGLMSRSRMFRSWREDQVCNTTRPLLA